ncbi:hypothetical protein F4810DRAFT_707004 [Camillea tinctor]|nr:hypothetical protein F4810DRAFT_707004 [Camillea tinctor]
MPSMSRISTAICARLAASATRFRSRMKTSVLGVFCAGGGGGANEDEDDGEPWWLWLIVVEEVVKAAAAVVMLVGEEMEGQMIN